jgi:hypothetical protein
MLLDRFNLVSLKELYTILKSQHYFNTIKTYQLCKYDLITLLRNTDLFDETQETNLLFYNPQDRKWLKLIPRKKLYDRGEKIKSMIIEEKRIVLNFN